MRPEPRCRGCAALFPNRNSNPKSRSKDSRLCSLERLEFATAASAFYSLSFPIPFSEIFSTTSTSSLTPL
jgi:hypothetical protein